MGLRRVRGPQDRRHPSRPAGLVPLAGRRPRGREPGRCREARRAGDRRGARRLGRHPRFRTRAPTPCPRSPVARAGAGRRAPVRARHRQRQHPRLRARDAGHLAVERAARGGRSPTMSVAFLPALEQARLVREGEISSLELVGEYLARIDRFDPELNAYVTVCADEARVEARSPRPGPFSGVPLPIKDLTETAGIRTTFSSKAFADYVPARDMEVVRRLRDAGFVVIGKTNTPEFGMTAVTESELNGACRNPWDPQRTPGGSSGGAAAALAAGLAPIAHGTDGGGSIRIPASCCGVFGVKPSRGRVSPAPRGDPYGLSGSGPIARTVADAAAFLDAIVGSLPGDPYRAPAPERPFADEVGAGPGRLRIGVALEPPHRVRVDERCAVAAREAGELLGELGHEGEAVSF